MKTALATGTILKVQDDETGETKNFRVEDLAYRGRKVFLYSGQIVGADDEAPSLLAKDLGEGFGELV